MTPRHNTRLFFVNQSKTIFAGWCVDLFIPIFSFLSKFPMLFNFFPYYYFSQSELTFSPTVFGIQLMNFIPFLI